MMLPQLHGVRGSLIGMSHLGLNIDSHLFSALVSTALADTHCKKKLLCQMLRGSAILAFGNKTNYDGVLDDYYKNLEFLP